MKTGNIEIGPDEFKGGYVQLSLYDSLRAENEQLKAREAFHKETESPNFVKLEELQKVIEENARLKAEKEAWGNEFTAVHTVKLENQSLRALLREAKAAFQVIGLNEGREWDIVSRIDAALGDSCDHQDSEHLPRSLPPLFRCRKCGLIYSK